MTRHHSTHPLSTKLALFIGAVGFAWAVVLVTPATFLLLGKPLAEKQKPYAVPGDTKEYGDWAQMSSRLKGLPAIPGKEARESCWGASAIWRDQDLMVRGRGPRNGSTETFWVAETVNSEAFFGRYSVDLWYLEKTFRDAQGLRHEIQQADNTRLIERFPPPPPGPPGWEVLQPGDCVLREAKPVDDEGTVGRFVIDLPAKTKIFERCGSRDAYGKKRFPVECSMTRNGRGVTQISVNTYGNGFDYQSEEGGRYEVVVRRSDPPEARKPDHGRWAEFYVMVTWGPGDDPVGCGPSLDQSNCFGEKIDE